jgi:hypothetical protein
VDNVAPTRRGSRFRFETAGVAFEVDADRGGRIAEFSLGGTNLLFEGGPDGNDGSTFWTSPQAAWSWPPPPEIDRDPYAVRAEDGRLWIASKRSALLGFSVEKDFSMAPGGTVTIDYRIRNESTEACAAAPWEVTRVHRSGVSFFPKGRSVERSPRLPAPSFAESDGLIWLEHAREGGSDRKLHADGPGGWLAHANRGILFLKTFDDVRPEAQAPSEAMVEIFVSGVAPYVELEAQGAYETLAPGASFAWRVQWRLLEQRGTSRAELAVKIRSLI